MARVTSKYPTVTIVLSTYNRPDTLAAAIQSVRLQTVRNWDMLVVGDRCDSRSGEAVASFADHRIRYINLPIRTGEQSGPNSVGIALATGVYLAFLNHDDLWLKDHLEYALDTLRESGADFFVGAAAFAHRSDETAERTRKPVFESMHRPGRHPRQSVGLLVWERPPAFEPASAWLVRTAVARKIGHWRSRDAVLGTYPILDWARRAWRGGARFVFGTRLSVLKITTQYQSIYRAEKGAYSPISQEHAYLTPILDRMSPPDFRTWILDELAKGPTMSDSGVRALLRKTSEGLRSEPFLTLLRISLHLGRTVAGGSLTPVARWLYYRFGFDLPGRLYSIAYSLRGKRRDATLVASVLMRTGERLERTRDIEAVVEAALALESRPGRRDHE